LGFLQKHNKINLLNSELSTFNRFIFERNLNTIQKIDDLVIDLQDIEKKINQTIIESHDDKYLDNIEYILDSIAFMQKKIDIILDNQREINRNFSILDNEKGIVKDKFNKK